MHQNYGRTPLWLERSGVIEERHQRDVFTPFWMLKTYYSQVIRVKAKRQGHIVLDLGIRAMFSFLQFI